MCKGDGMNLANSMEMEKSRGYWRSKGFTRPADYSVRLDRDDCRVVYRYNSWQMIENGETKPRHKSKSLYTLLSSFT